jgi:ComF family protein
MTTALTGLGRRLPPLWSAHCLVCREPCGAGVGVFAAGPIGASAIEIGLCPACRDGLPWNRSACARCALPMPEPTPTCGRCLRRPPPLTETRAAFVYGPPLDRLLPRLKFHDDLAAGRLLAGLMAEAWNDEARPDDEYSGEQAPSSGLASATAPFDAECVGAAHTPPGSRPDLLIPLPLHRRRLRARGYDQALELARPLARQLGLPLRTDLLHRRRDTAPQSRLDAPARRKNLRGAFAVDIAALARMPALPAHVVLIDDVMTTGATLHAAAEALLRAGVARVDAWVCARVA